MNEVVGGAGASAASPPRGCDPQSTAGRGVDEQAILFRFTDRLYRAESRADVYDAALDAILDALGCQRASILLCDDAGVMRFVAWRGLSATYREAVDGHTPWRPGQKAPHPICVADIETADEPDWLKETIKREGVRALSFVPLTENDAVIGKFMTYYEWPHVFAEHETAVALTIARQLGFSLERMRTEEARRAAEVALRHEREVLQTIVDRIPAIITLYEPDKSIRRVNPAFERVLGWSAAEAEQRSLMEQCFPEPAYRAEVESFMDAAGGGWMDMRMRSRDGRDVETSWANVRLSDGTQVGIGLDITERKQSEVALRRQTDRLDALNRIARSVASDLDLERIVQVVTDSATELSGAQFGAFLYNVTDEDGERYTLFTLSGAPRAAFEKFGLPHNTAVFGPTFRGEGIIRSDDIRADPRYGKSPPHYGLPKDHPPVVSYLAVPVISRSGVVHGGLFFGHDRPGVFTDEIEDIVAAIAAHAAIAIDNAQLLRAAQGEIERRRRTEMASQRLAAIVESSEDAILAKDLDGIITSWNHGAERLFGYTADEVIGKPVTILIPEDRQDEEPEILARIRSGQPINQYETVRRRKDGSLIDISLTVSPIRSADGVVVGASKIARDITERRRADERQHLLLREMDHRIKNLFALAGSVISLSARSAATPQELASVLHARMGALARAHALTRSQSPGVLGSEQATTMHALVRTILSPYDGAMNGESTRVLISGPDIAIGGSAVTAFALLLHEFATNAAKYGALSVPDGRIAIVYAEDGDRFLLTWTEHGGPHLDRPADGDGFGTLLARATVEGQLAGSISRDWRPTGLAIRLSVRRDRLAPA